MQVYHQSSKVVGPQATTAGKTVSCLSAFMKYLILRTAIGKIH
jgi:hypothetical protein